MHSSKAKIGVGTWGWGGEAYGYISEDKIKNILPIDTPLLFFGSMGKR